jgi:hypothetical protein
VARAPAEERERDVFEVVQAIEGADAIGRRVTRDEENRFQDSAS